MTDGYQLYNGRYYPADPDGWEEHTCGTCDMWQLYNGELGTCAVQPRLDPMEPDHPACPRWAWGWTE